MAESGAPGAVRVSVGNEKPGAELHSAAALHWRPPTEAAGIRSFGASAVRVLRDKIPQMVVMITNFLMVSLVLISCLNAQTRSGS